MLAQINDGCAIRRLVAQYVDPQIALRDLQIALRDRQIAQIRRLRLTSTHTSSLMMWELTLDEWEKTVLLNSWLDASFFGDAWWSRLEDIGQ